MPGTLTPTALLRAVTAAGESPDLDLQDAITTAYSWHGGGGSALYAFASNGGVIADENQRTQLLAEVERDLAFVQMNAGDINSGKFPEYAEDAEEAEERGISTTDLITARMNNLKAIASQAVIVKEASKQATTPLTADDLRLYLENTGALYPQHQSIIKNLSRKMDKGTYDPNLAWRLWLYWVVAGAQAYAKEMGGGVWYQLFPVPVREALAKELSQDEEARIRNGEYAPRAQGAPADLPEPVMASVEKDAKVLISEDVFRRAQDECQQLLSQIAGQGSELEGKLTKIQHELNKIEVGSGGDLAFSLDDENNPAVADWARKLIQALSSLKNGVGQGAEAPSPNHALSSPGAGVTAGFAEDTLKALVQFARVHKEELAHLLNSSGPQAVAAELGKIPGAGNLAPRVAPAFVQWLTGHSNDSAFVGMLERFFSKRGSLQDEDAMHMVSGALRMAGFRPASVKASGRDITLEGLRVNPHVLRVTARVASDYGVLIKIKKAEAYNAPGEQPGQFPEPTRQEPTGIQHTGPESAPVVTPTEAADKTAAPIPPRPSAAGNHAGPANPNNPTGEPAPGTPHAAPQPIQQEQAPAPEPEAPKAPTGYGQAEDGTAYGQKKASEAQGDVFEAVQTAYEWHGGQSSYLYSFASLGGVLYKESWRGGLENEVESAIESVQRTPDRFEADELEKLQNLLSVVQTIPAQTDDSEQDEGVGVQAAKQAADGNLTGTLTEIESMLNSLQELADTAVAQARLQGDPDLSANVERINVKVYEALMATRTGKVDAKDKPGPETEGAQTVTLVPVAASAQKEAIGPWGGEGHFVRQTMNAPKPAPAVCKTPECGEKAEANGYCIYCGDPKSVPGKCDYCDAPVPPELKAENVCPGCAGQLRSHGHGEDGAAHHMMSSLHVAAPAEAPGPVFDVEQAKQWLEAIKTQVQAPYVGGYVSTLGGDKNVSILLTVAADPKDSWPNHILENSTYVKLHLTNDGVLEAISGNIRSADGNFVRIKIRKTRVKELTQAVAKINAMVTYLNAAKGTTAVQASKQAAEQLTKGPDASKGDTVDNAIEFINANSGSLVDFTVQELRDALASAGYTQQVADEAVTDLLGNEALMALASPVKNLLG